MPPRKNNTKTKTNSKTKTNTKTKLSSKSLSNSLRSLSTIPGSQSGPGRPLSPSIESTIVIFGIILSIAALIINIYALNWINKLESIPECKCSNSWMRTYIKYYLYVIIPFMVIILSLNIYLYLNNLSSRDMRVYLYNNSLLTSYTFFIVNIAAFVNMIISIIFINRLKEINCECSEDVRRDVYYIYNIVLASLICITVLMFFIFIPIAAILRSR
jgi:hypothetical protein